MRLQILNKMKMEERTATQKRWWFILSWNDEKLINFYTKLIECDFNHLDIIRDFVSQYNCEQAKRIKSRIDRISGQAILNRQNLQQIDNS